MEEPLRRLRKAFPALDQGLVFLDWAATGLISEPVRRGVEDYLARLAACPGRESTWIHAEHHATREEVRAAVAGLLGIAPADVALVENTTAGLNGAASSIRLERGQNVILSSIDYLAVSTPWKHRARRDGIELRFVPPRGPEISASDLLDRIDAGTRVIAVSTMAWTTGALVDIELLAKECRQRGILLVVDAIQTFGVVPLDAARPGIAFVAAGGHKWLASALGAGFLAVAPGIAARHQPPFLGFLSGRPPRGTWADWFQDPAADPAEEVVFPATARAFESGGTPSYVGAVGLREGLRLLSEAGVERILAHARALGDRLIAGADALGIGVLTPRDRLRRGGVVVLQAPSGVEEERRWQAGLRERGIVVSCRYACGLGGLRVSLHGMNDEEDVDRLLLGLRSLRER
jgi:cysteine desulfurase/selenocysteine lyase